MLQRDTEVSVWGFSNKDGEMVSVALDNKPAVVTTAKDGNPNSSSVLRNGMIAPLIPYAFRGVIWNQGESNRDKARECRTTFPNMIADWRTAWGRGDFPFSSSRSRPTRGCRAKSASPSSSHSFFSGSWK